MKLDKEREREREKMRDGWMDGWNKSRMDGRGGWSKRTRSLDEVAMEAQGLMGLDLIAS